MALSGPAASSGSACRWRIAEAVSPGADEESETSRLIAGDVAWAAAEPPNSSNVSAAANWNWPGSDRDHSGGSTRPTESGIVEVAAARPGSNHEETVCRSVARAESS